MEKISETPLLMLQINIKPMILIFGIVAHEVGKCKRSNGEMYTHNDSDSTRTNQELLIASKSVVLIFLMRARAILDFFTICWYSTLDYGNEIFVYSSFAYESESRNG